MMHDPRPSLEEFTGGLMRLQAALSGDFRPRLSNGNLASRRGGFGTFAGTYLAASKLPTAKVSKRAKRRARAKAKTRRAHR